MISTCVTLVQIKQQLCSDFEIYVMDHHITWYGSLACQRKRPDVGILHESWQINVSRPLPATGILVPKQFILTLFIICLVSYRHSLEIKESSSFDSLHEWSSTQGVVFSVYWFQGVFLHWPGYVVSEKYVNDYRSWSPFDSKMVSVKPLCNE